MRGLPPYSEHRQSTGVIYKFEEHSFQRNSIGRFLHDSRTDPVTGTHLRAASLVLRYLFPVYDLERNVPADTKQLQEIVDKHPGISDRFACHITGSSIERLSVPPYTERHQEEQVPFYNIADVDMMVELCFLSVAPRKGTGLAYMDPSQASHSGYVRVILDARPIVLETLPFLKDFCKTVRDGDSDVLYISIDALNDGLAADSAWKRLSEDIRIKRQGPAVNLEEDERVTRPSRHNRIFDIDFVPALPLTDHQKELSGWLSRVSADHVLWPSKTTREDVCNNGRCFLVGAGHASSQRRDLEWRVSFSDPEKRLAASMTPCQRKVYVVVKLIQKCYLREPKVIVTYHIKTLMFWELETCGVSVWAEEDVFEHVLKMLDRLQQCLEEHCIPSYFNPKNNLISHASKQDVAAVLAIIQQIRLTPLQHIYGIDERFQFDFSSSEPLSQLHAPLRETVLAGDVNAVPDVLVISLIRQAQSDVHRGIQVLPRCVDLLRDAWEALAPPKCDALTHPVHSDWVVFATAAVFSSMEVDESAWLIEAIRIALAAEKRHPPPPKEITDDEAQALGIMMKSIEIPPEMPDDIYKDKSKTTCGMGIENCEGSPSNIKTSSFDLLKSETSDNSGESAINSVHLKTLIEPAEPGCSTDKNMSQPITTGATKSERSLCLNVLTTVLEQTQQTGLLPQASQAFYLLSLRHAQLELIRDAKNTTNENIVGNPPLIAAARKTQVNLEFINLSLKFQLIMGVPQAVAAAEATQSTLALCPDILRKDNGMGNVEGTIQQVISLVDPTGTENITTEILSEMNGLGASMKETVEESTKLAFETNPNVISIIPMHMIAMFIQIIGTGITEEQADHMYTPFFNMLGFFLKNKMFTQACRMTLRLNFARTATLSIELEQFIYDIYKAPMYVKSLPSHVQDLLRLSSGRTVLGVLYLFIDFMNMLFDAEFMSKCLNFSQDLQNLERLTALSGLPEDVRLTHQVMHLCVLQVLHMDHQDCLRRVEQASGSGTACRAVAILREWDLTRGQSK